MCIRDSLGPVPHGLLALHYSRIETADPDLDAAEPKGLQGFLEEHGLLPGRCQGEAGVRPVQLLREVRLLGRVLGRSDHGPHGPDPDVSADRHQVSTGRHRARGDHCSQRRGAACHRLALRCALLQRSLRTAHLPVQQVDLYGPGCRKALSEGAPAGVPGIGCQDGAIGLFFLKRAGLQTRIVMLSALSTLVMLAVFGISSALTVNESIDRTLRERLVLAQTAAELTDRVLRQNLQYLQDIAVNPSINLSSGDQEAGKQTLRDAYFHSIFSDGVYILDRNGLILLMEPTMPDASRRDLSSYPNVRESLQTGKPSISNVYTTPITRRPVVTLLYPILDDQHRIAGLVGGDIDVTNPSLAGIIQPVKVGRTGYSQTVSYTHL